MLVENDEWGETVIGQKDLFSVYIK